MRHPNFIRLFFLCYSFAPLLPLTLVIIEQVVSDRSVGELDQERVALFFATGLLPIVCLPIMLSSTVAVATRKPAALRFASDIYWIYFVLSGILCLGVIGVIVERFVRNNLEMSHLLLILPFLLFTIIARLNVAAARMYDQWATDVDSFRTSANTDGKCS